METKSLEEYARELFVVNVWLTGDESSSFTFNGYDNLPEYIACLAILELNFVNKLQEDFPSGVIDAGTRRLLGFHFSRVEKLFLVRHDGSVTRSDLMGRSAGGERVAFTRATRRNVDQFVRIQQESLARVCAFVREHDEFSNFPYRFSGRTAELAHFCVLIYTCKRVDGIVDEAGLCEFMRVVFRLLKKKEPARPDLLVRRILTCKNQLKYIDKLRKEYQDEIMKGK